ncbi:MAG: hypothetical protein V2J42_13550 [Wenzhouxiangella sp.]|jgi:hypothetical protein|nr:hypothetical protein [Wenzhouxiangella sp.]
MPPLFRWFAILITLLLLSGCGKDEEEPEAPAAPPSDTVEAAPRSAPADTPPGPSQAAAVSTESTTRAEAVQQARAERERLRERHDRDRLHWDEAALTEQLGLSADQFQALQAARQTLLEERVTVRTGLQAQRQFRAQAEAATDGARLEEIGARTAQLRTQLEIAEQAWRDALRSILDAEQLEELAEQRPELFQPSGDR